MFESIAEHFSACMRKTLCFSSVKKIPEFFSEEEAAEAKKHFQV